MGFTELGTESIMKILLVIALFGAVQAESDPGFFYHTGVPLVYTHPHPVVYANNVCTNEAGAVVPCANPVAPASGIYSFADAPAGLVPVVGAAAAPAAEAEGDAVVSVEKRSADPSPWGYYGWGWGWPRGGGYLAKPASIANIDYGKTGIKYLKKREAEPEAEADADADADAAADAWYGYYGHGYGHYGYGYGYASPYYYGGYAGYRGYGYYGLGYGYAGYYGGCRNGYGAPVPCAGK